MSSIGYLGFLEKKKKERDAEQTKDGRIKKIFLSIVMSKRSFVYLFPCLL